MTEHDERQARIEHLAAAAAQGDNDALNDLLALVRPDVVARCGRFLPNRMDAEEAAQDTLVSVAQSIASFDGRARFTTWLHTVTTNRSIDTYRRLKRQMVDPNEVPDLPADRRTSVIAGTRVDLLEALEAVDDKYAVPVALRDLCTLDYNEIAAQLDLPLGTVKSRINEGRQRIQRLLTERSD